MVSLFIALKYCCCTYQVDFCSYPCMYVFNIYHSGMECGVIGTLYKHMQVQYPEVHRMFKVDVSSVAFIVNL